MVAGVEPPTGDAVEPGGRDVTRPAPFARDVNTAFQHYAPSPHLSVAHDTAHGLKVPEKERRERATQAHGRAAVPESRRRGVEIPTREKETANA